jgi:flagellar biogenesis protein FliO
MGMVALMQVTGGAPDLPGAGALGLRSLLATAVVIALLAAAAWALRATAASRRSRQSMIVESAVSLGDKRSLAIVTVEGRRLLLGLAPGNVSLVTELRAPFNEALASSLETGGQA